MIRAEAEYPRVAFFATPSRMEPKEIRERLRRSGRSQASLGRHLGASKDSVSRLLSGQRRMQAVELRQIEEFFADDGPKGPAFETIDVYGYAQAGGTDRIGLASDQVIDRIEIPAGMVRGPAIGIRVAGDSMEPRLFSGETVIVALNVAPARDRDCVVEFRDGTGIVKQYRGQREGQVFLWQYNPEEELRVDASKVKAIHAVLYRR